MPEDEINTKLFPSDFLWGASTSAHQVEGSNHNDWTVWELQNANRFAQTAEARFSHWLPVWPEIKDQAKDPNNYISGRGVDHYNRYEEDFDILAKLNLNTFRFGIEWSRIEPEEGRWDREAINHYKEYIKELNKRGIEPVLNIWHWTVPVWFAEKGYFEKKRNLKYWQRFIRKVAEEFCDDLTYVITLNEPNIYMSYSYITGERPPQEKNFMKAILVFMHLAQAHRMAYRILKKRKRGLQIGVAAQLANIQAKRPHNFFDEVATKWMRYSWNWWFLRRIRKYQDFIGLNYYFTDYYEGFARRNPDESPSTMDDQEQREADLPAIVRINPKVPVNDLRWYMEPEGLYPLLLRTWARFKKPIIVTENGVADSHDEYRRWWLEETIVSLEKALSEGVEVKGYFYWSLLDNFEWDFGWWPKFGLVKVDREHGMKRTIRPSARWFAQKISELSK